MSDLALACRRHGRDLAFGDVCYLRGVTSPFEGRAAAYASYRSPYPVVAIECVIARAGLGGSKTVADLGSGTGLLSAALLNHAQRLYAVEPAANIRRAAEAALGNRPEFRSLAGTAEATSLDADSIDVVASGNAFHYFDPEGARREVDRILRRKGRVVLLFDDWPHSPRGFTRDYQDLVDRVTPHELQSTHARDKFEQRLGRFFGDRVPVRDEASTSRDSRGSASLAASPPPPSPPPRATPRTKQPTRSSAACSTGTSETARSRSRCGGGVLLRVLQPRSTSSGHRSARSDRFVDVGERRRRSCRRFRAQRAPSRLPASSVTGASMPADDLGSHHSSRHKHGLRRGPRTRREIQAQTEFDGATSRVEHVRRPPERAHASAAQSILAPLSVCTAMATERAPRNTASSRRATGRIPDATPR